MTGGIAKGEPWGEPSAGPASIVVDGDDAALAAAVGAHPDGVRLAWHAAPGADFARAVGVSGPDEPATLDLPCDAIVVTPVPSGSPDPATVDAEPLVAVNMAVFGFRPDQLRRTSTSHGVRVVVDGRVVHEGPATSVVIANGQFLHGADVVPRGHPGDGRLEVQVYAVPRGERRALRQRLATGSHVPHPGIRQASGRSVELSLVDTKARAPERGLLEIDGATPIWVAGLRADVRERAFVLVR